MRLRRSSAVVAVCLVIATGCQVDTTVRIAVEDDGSGTVSVEVVLDAEAFDRIDDLDTQLRVDDLVTTGWEVSGPELTDDGGRRVVVTKPFADPESANRVLAEVTGPDAGLIGATVSRSRSFGQVRQGVEATIDLSAGVDGFGDAALTQLLGGLPVGQDVTQLEAELGAPLADVTSFAVVVDLPPGDVSSTGDPQVIGAGDRRVVRWEASLGDPPLAIGAQTETTDWLVVGLALLAVACALGLLAIWFRHVRAHRQALMAAERH